MYDYIKKKDDNETMNKLREVADKQPADNQDIYYYQTRWKDLKWNYKVFERKIVPAN